MTYYPMTFCYDIRSVSAIPTSSPGLVHRALLLELLSQVIKSLQAADLGQQPLLIALLHPLQTLPGIGNILEEREVLSSLYVANKDF